MRTTSDIISKVEKATKQGTENSFNLLEARLYLQKPEGKRLRRLSMVGTAFFTVIAVLIYTAGLTKADIAQFYPATCLGTWGNATLSQSEPETTVGTSTAFSEENSAVLLAGTSSQEQIFCGGFLLPDYEAKGVIDHIGLSFVWRMEFASSSGIYENQPTDAGFGGEEPSADFEPKEVLESAPEDIQERAVENPGTGNLENETSIFEQLFARFMPQALAQEAETSAETPAEPQPEASAAAPVGAVTEPPSEALDVTTAEPPVDVQAEPTVETVAEAREDKAENSEETFAEAIGEESAKTLAETSAESETKNQDSVAAESSTEETAQISEPKNEIVAEVLGMSTIEEASTTAETLAATSTVQLATSSEEAVGIDPKDGFLLIRYSLDGKNWFNLAQVNRLNFPNFTTVLPVTSWDEVENLQISVEEVLGSEDQANIVYLDGVIMEIHFDLPAFLGDVLPENPVTKEIASLIDNFASDPAEAPANEEPAPPPAAPAREAEQECAIEPFTRSVKRGNETEFALLLAPSGKASGAMLNPGSLPQGLNVRFGADAIGLLPQKIPLYIFADRDARVGSFNISVLYKELYLDGYESVAACQFNPVAE